MPTFPQLLMEAMRRLKPAMKFLVAATLVLATYGIWAVKTWQGQPVNPLVVVLALVLTTAAARVVFGAGALSKALDTVRDVAELTRGGGDEEDKPDEKK